MSRQGLPAPLTNVQALALTVNMTLAITMQPCSHTSLKALVWKGLGMGKSQRMLDSFRTAASLFPLRWVCSSHSETNDSSLQNPFSIHCTNNVPSACFDTTNLRTKCKASNLLCLDTS
eukprot:1194561-Prorocentrum_minimum.AAC.4